MSPCRQAENENMAPPYRVKMEKVKSDERQVLCSNCLQARPESSIHVIPR
jgi:hypothetical protein